MKAKRWTRTKLKRPHITGDYTPGRCGKCYYFKNNNFSEWSPLGYNHDVVYFKSSMNEYNTVIMYIVVNLCHKTE